MNAPWNGNGGPIREVDPDGPPEESGEAPDLVDALRATRLAAGEAEDITLSGYVHEHERPPAFEGADGQPYTVEVMVEETDESARPFVSWLLFLRWAGTGAGIMQHVESGDVAHGATEEEARARAGELTLFEVRAELDAAIARRRAEAEE